MQFYNDIIKAFSPDVKEPDDEDELEIEMQTYPGPDANTAGQQDGELVDGTDEGEPDVRMSWFEMMIRILLFRSSGYSPSAAALVDFQQEMGRRSKLKQKKKCRGRPTYKFISVSSDEVPSDITYDRMMKGATYPPLNRNSFVTFLKNIDYNYNNFRFIVLLQHYERLHDAVSWEHRTALSPPWTFLDEQRARKAYETSRSRRRSIKISCGLPFRNGDYTPLDSSDSLLGENQPTTSFNIYNPTPLTSLRPAYLGLRNVIGLSLPGSAGSDIDSVAPFSFGTRDNGSSVSSRGYDRVSYEDDEHLFGPRLPIAVQNLWKTGSQIMTEFIATNGEHALNLSHLDREMTLYALERSNHPSAMNRAQKVADDVLRNDSYPRFLQVSKPDGSPIRQRIIKLVGWLLISTGLIFAGAVTMSHLSWLYRLIGVPLVVCGVAAVYAAHLGLCLVLYSLGTYQAEPWDLYTPADEQERERINPEVFLDGDYKPGKRGWVKTYNRRYALLKIFGRDTPVKEARILNAQTVIAGQAIFLGLLAGAIMVVLAKVVPTVKYY
ncbi:uncharacterized protein L3040_000052 [Drepanopeziza brunnea f. sp. 'multigermtubi']|uniref:RGS domain-containing protein n=1 Tax=Marssonina brunnea f. sp. multigermtubi (strain MB_m1) TaxID=1072389 RepID=K1WNK1_MARBU|nr:uncharacterized protein MBM_07252 [Drepanopeziza brunnea f. sp. 'multigermtubi' MB_m1]EKD14531.1 hypothetical protein MBM_07252 [Drepanopeziza brunnea f. sp. 'multigermtubi' MB_m1]KAJ5053761.1 hypothetical protein L3040_000052 [Drepanopeziza brunnea f. sp. 'multigermtubi']